MTVSARRLLGIVLVAGPLVACDGTLQFSGAHEDVVDATTAPEGRAEEGSVGSDASLVDGVTPSDGGAPDRRVGLAPPCYKGTDCPVNKLHCDLDTNECVECLADTNCTVLPYLRCLTSVHRCVECLTEGDCSPGSACHPTTHICVSLCSDGGACPAAQPYCDSHGQCAECRTNADCAQVDVCDLEIGRCAFCAIDKSCVPPVSYCDPYNPGRNRCKECLEPSQCPAERPYCDVHGRVCVAGL